VYQTIIVFMARLAFCFLSFLLFSISVFAQSPKREFRAAWIATVSNIDWPSKPGLTSMQQQEEFIKRLDQLKQLGCNAVIVQIRPASDAFYDSPDEPWSRFLTGRQGQPPYPFYDPLKFMVDQTHMRSMEFHAWFNPFRALTDSKKNPNPPDHITRKHPDWIVSYGGKSYINPGIPEAREYVIRVITHVAKNYDIDAVHIDDYFYPYRIAGQEFGDAVAYNKYGKGFTNKDDWRRNNVNLFISVLNTNLKQDKSYMKLGISPFGVWRNKSKDPEGSNTRGGQTTYDDLYADVLLWMRKGWIDYLLPQLYWERKHKAAAFDILFPWWEEHSYGRHIYYGLGVYRIVGATKAPWLGSGELLAQMTDIRKNAENPGHVFYSTSSFDKISNTVSEDVSDFNKYPALPPRMKWLDSIAPATPILKTTASSRGVLLKWEPGARSEEPLRYVVYRFAQGEQVNLDRADRIISIQNTRELMDTDETARKSKYVVTALDRLWNESASSNIEPQSQKR
jgi:uncharacterized lipoprotein YddW (UPF0748 family)